ncbi:hypothetical protein AB0L97_32795 [Nocardia sp. NPDC051911]|uniref:hypothetical protein n=1 Tax=Nocardia sp. NPDC051911 TaxID=3154648 RepID=UPI0034135AFC
MSYAHSVHADPTEGCPDCGTTRNSHPSYCRYQDAELIGCPRGCPEGECYCAEMTYAEANDVCRGCGAWDGDCYCGEG